MLKQHYETTFGIFDHRAAAASGKRPWLSQAWFPNNASGKIIEFDRWIEQYDELGIWDILHMDFITYLSLPPARAKEINAKCKSIKENKIRKENILIEEERKRAMLALQNKGNAGNGVKPPGL